MATRSTISVKVSETAVRTIYSHWDGYPSHHYPILAKNYNSQDLAEKLVSFGAISCLDEKCDKPDGHTFDTPKDGYTTYYGRDRGEEGVDFDTYKTFADVRDIQEYHYYWNGTKWEVYDDDNNITTDCENGKYVD